MPLTDHTTDAELVAGVGAVVSRPRAEAANSFVLHAPLELAARTALLPHVAPAQRDEARARIAAVATEYEAFGPGAPEPRQRGFDSVVQGAERLSVAIGAGDLDQVDAVAAWLGQHATPVELRTLLADEVVPRLSAAGHAPIFLYQLPRVAPGGELPGTLLRPLVRELARYPEWRLSWMDERPAHDPLPPAALLDAIRSTPQLGVPGSDFIYPLMAQVESSGVAAELLAAPTQTSDFDGAARVVLRTAAWSMLQEPPDHAPYGWTHCLTMPQAVLGIASSCRNPSTALAVAATYVVGFRAAFASGPLRTSYAPADPGVDLATAFTLGPAAAAAAAWHSSGDLVTTLATRASVHEDAHLVKYTLACLDLATWDPAFARLYLAAAASLVAFWTRYNGAYAP